MQIRNTHNNLFTLVYIQYLPSLLKSRASFWNTICRHV